MSGHAVTCAEMERLLDRRDTDPATRAAMLRHAEACPECRLLMELRALDHDETLPDTAAARWRAAVREEAAGRARPARRRIGPMIPALAAAAVLVAAVALRSPARTQDSPLTSTSVTEESAAVAKRAAPVLTANPTQLPPLTTALPLESAAEIAGDASVADADLADWDEAPMLAMYVAEEAPTDEAEADEAEAEEAGALDEAVSAGADAPEWTVRSPAPLAAARRVLNALGIADEPSAGPDGAVRLRLTLRAEDWPVFRAACEQNGWDAAQSPFRDDRPTDTIQLKIEGGN